MWLVRPTCHDCKKHSTHSQKKDGVRWWSGDVQLAALGCGSRLRLLQSRQKVRVRMSTTSSSAVDWWLKMRCLPFRCRTLERVLELQVRSVWALCQLRSVRIQRHYASVKHDQSLQGWRLTDCRSANFPKSGIKEGCSWFSRCLIRDFAFFWSDLFLIHLKNGPPCY